MDGDRTITSTQPAPDGRFDGSLPHAGPARVGAELRMVREQLGWTLPALSARLKIRLPFLEAIEAGDLAALPAPAYAAGFIRTYADAMGLDPDEILRRFRAEGMTRAPKPELTFPDPVPDRAVPPMAVALIVAVIAIGAYALWYHHSEEQIRAANAVPAVPATLAPLASGSQPAGGTGTTPKTAGTPDKTGTPPAIGALTQGAAPSKATATGKTGTPPTGTPPAGTPPAGTPLPRMSGPALATAAATPSAGTGSATPSATATHAAAAAPSASGTGAAATASGGAAAPEATSPGPATTGTATPGAAKTPSTGTPTTGTASTGAASASTISAQSKATTPSGGTATPESGTATGGSTASAASPGTATASAATQASSSPPAPAAPAGGPPLQVRAIAKSWVQVRGPQGKVVFSGILDAGQTWTVPDQPGLVMTTGNAGGTELVRNGKAGTPLGTPGSVLHGVQLTGKGNTAAGGVAAGKSP